MKRIKTLLFVSLMVLSMASFTACGSRNATGNTDNGTGAQNGTVGTDTGAGNGTDTNGTGVNDTGTDMGGTDTNGVMDNNDNLNDATAGANDKNDDGIIDDAGNAIGDAVGDAGNAASDMIDDAATGVENMVDDVTGADNDGASNKMR